MLVVDICFFVTISLVKQDCAKHPLASLETPSWKTGPSSALTNEYFDSMSPFETGNGPITCAAKLVLDSHSSSWTATSPHSFSPAPLSLFLAFHDFQVELTMIVILFGWLPFTRW